MALSSCLLPGGKLIVAVRTLFFICSLRCRYSIRQATAHTIYSVYDVMVYTVYCTRDGCNTPVSYTHLHWKDYEFECQRLTFPNGRQIRLTDSQSRQVQTQYTQYIDILCVLRLYLPALAVRQTDLSAVRKGQPLTLELVVFPVQMCIRDRCITAVPSAIYCIYHHIIYAIYCMCCCLPDTISTP